MSPPSLEDVAWLTSDRARPYLDRTTNHRGSLTALAKSLRKELSLQRTHLVLEQVELRARARTKFKYAERMFFTRQSLQQATNEDIARHVASRFPVGESVADLCCGIGGNLLALAKRGPATGVERDPVVAHFAQCNERVTGEGTADVDIADAATYSLDGHAAFFVDPDRRAHGRRTVDLKYYQPGLAALNRLISDCPNAAAKLAPATAVTDQWRNLAELEWIGYARQCKQQVAWFGEVARHPGRCVATVCPRGELEVRTIVQNLGARPNTTDQLEDFIYIPHVALVTARLVNTIAVEHSLSQIKGTTDLLTGEKLIFDKALTSFQAVAECSLHAKTVSSLLEKHDIAPSVVRTVGRRGTPPKVLEKLAGNVGKMGGLFISGQSSKRRVTVAVRCTQPG